MPLIIPSNSISAGGFAVDNSLRFNSGSSDTLNRTPASSGNRKTWTWSSWVKRTTLNEGGNGQYLFGASESGDLSSRQGIFWSEDTGGLSFICNDSGTFVNVNVDAKSRDVSAWYHIVVAFDTTQTTTSDRIKIYINGELQSWTSADINNLTQNKDFWINDTVPHYIGRDSFSARKFNDGYLAETVLIDGSALDPTSFGEFDEDSGIWKPIDVSGLTFGTNGFYLDFKNSGSLGADVSGNGNNFTVNNLTAIDQTTDTPTNNFCTTNPLDQNGGMVFSDGNLSTASTSASWRSTRGTFGMTQGKWYWEVKAVNTGGSLLDMMVGVASFDIAIPAEFSSSNPALTYTAGSGNKQLNGVNTAYGATYNVGDIIGVAFDADALTVTFYKNGVSQGVITTGWSSGVFWSPAISLYGRYGNTQASWNFGNAPFTISSGNTDGNGYGNFEYSVPSGYYALNTKNLAEYG